MKTDNLLVRHQRLQMDPILRYSDAVFIFTIYLFKTTCRTFFPCTHIFKLQAMSVHAKFWHVHKIMKSVY
jgi:hypothetical protein